jgi:hypothetical protein
MAPNKIEEIFEKGADLGIEETDLLPCKTALL